MKNWGFSSLVALALSAGLCSIRANTIVWSGASSGNWSVKSNWNPNHVPGANDIAVITNSGNYTVTLDVNANVGGLILGTTSIGSTQTLFFNGQTFTLNGQATVSSNGQFNLSSGTFLGATNNSGGAVFNGTLAPSGGTLAGKLTIASNSVLNLSATNAISGLTLLTNYGTVVWSNAILYGSASLQIFNFDLWDDRANDFFNGNGTVFNNFGTFRKSAGGTTTTLDSSTTFNSSGTVDVQSGTLTIQTGTCSGIFGTASGTILNFGYNPNLITFTLTGNTTFTGDGIIEGYLNGNNVVLGGVATCSALTLSGTMTITNNGLINLVGTIGSNTFNGVLTNYGTVAWSNTDLYSSSNPQIYNYGLWDAKADNFLHGNGSIIFNNLGTFRKSSGNGTTTLDNSNPVRLEFENSGTVDVESGILAIGYGHASGTFQVASGTFINFGIGGSGGGPYNLTGNTTFTGSGIVEGILGFEFNNILLSGTMTFSNGAWWGDGGPGSLTIASNAVMNLVGGTSFNEYFLLTNYGTVNWISGDLSVSGGGEIDNYGLWNTQCNATFSGVAFNNYGTFRKSGGSVYDNSPYATILDNSTTFNNYGTLDDQVGYVGFYGGGTGRGVINITSAIYAGIYFHSVYTLTGSSTFSGGGEVSGNFTGNNAVIQGSLILNVGTLAGTITVASNATLNLGLVPQQTITFQGTILTNYGTVVWNYDDLDCQSSPQIYNYGLWDAQTNNTFYGAYSGGGTTTFNNFGTFRKSGGSVYDATPPTFDINTTFNNYGTLDDQSGIVIIYNGTGSGVFNTTSNAAIHLASYTLTGDSTFTGNGILNGNLTGNNAVVHGTELFDYGAFSGTLTLATNNVLNLVGIHGFTQPITFTAVVLTNYGTVVWSNLDLNGQSSPQIYNYGLWDAQTNNTLSGAVFNNYGTFRKSGGGAGGNSVLDSNTTFNNPGTLDVQTGLLNLNGNYALAGGTLNFGINSSGDYGSISLAGTATLAGSFSVNLNNGYSPGTGSSFALLGYGSETGMFTATSLPHLSGLIWQSNYGVTSFTLNLISLPPMQLSPATTLNGSSISFSWGAFDGQTYQVQCTTNLSPANWFNLGNPIPGTNGTTTVSDAFGSSPQKFYRVVSPP